MLRDYCPIMCGLCRPIRKKTPKIVLEQQNNILFSNPSTESPKFTEMSTLLSPNSTTRESPVNSSQVTLIKEKSPQYKKTEETFDASEITMADTPEIDDDSENTYYAR